MYNIYVKSFECDTRKKYSATTFPYQLSEVLPLKFEWNLFMEAMRNGNMLNTTYILCPTYDLQDGTPPDYQVSVTGRPTRNETAADAINREIGEEVGLQLTDGTSVHIFGNGKTKHAFIDIKHTRPLDSAHHVKKGRDVGNFRISVIIYGTLEEMLAYGRTDTIRLCDPNEHRHLTRVCIIPLGFLRDIVKPRGRCRYSCKKIHK